MNPRRISRQRKWQITNLAAGKCKLCPEMRGPDDSTFCLAHREAYREQMREYMRNRRRVTGVV